MLIFPTVCRDIVHIQLPLFFLMSISVRPLAQSGEERSKWIEYLEDTIMRHKGALSVSKKYGCFELSAF